MISFPTIQKNIKVQFTITDNTDICLANYNYNTEFQTYLNKNKSCFRKITIPRPDDFEPLTYQFMSLVSDDITIIAYSEFAKVDSENIQIICESKPETWDNLKELSLYYFVHDKRTESEQIETKIKELQKRLDELQTNNS